MLICDEITLSQAKQSDLNQIIAIWQNGWYKVHPNSTITQANIDKFIANFHSQQFPYGFWVLRLEEQVAGWVSVLPAFYHPMKEKSEAEISIYIDQKHSNKGFGTLITKHVLNEISHSEIKSVWAFVSLHNTRSKKMCTRAGLRICGQTSSKYLMIKEFT